MESDTCHTRTEKAQEAKTLWLQERKFLLDTDILPSERLSTGIAYFKSFQNFCL